MTHRGYVPLYRKWILDPHHDLAPTLRDPACDGFAWMFLVSLAQHDHGYYHKGLRLERGQFMASLRWLADRMGWGRGSKGKRRAERFMNRLIERDRIRVAYGTPNGTVYSIVNYDTYAVARDTERDGMRDTERDGDGTAKGRERTQEHRNTGNNTHPRAGEIEFQDDPPRLPLITQEQAKAKGVDIDLEWAAFQADYRANGRTYDDIPAAFGKWVIGEIRRDQSRKPATRKLMPWD